MKVKIEDGLGQGNFVKVDKEGAQYVVVHPHPPKDEVDNALPFRQRFTDNGAPSGSSAMNVDGSTTAESFYVSASTEYDVYINSISVIIGDGGSPALNKFGALSALTNGVEWVWTSQDIGTLVLHDGIKTNLEFIRTGSKTGAIGTGSDAYLADVSGGGTEKSYMPTIDLSEQFGLPWGIRLRKGTTDRISFNIRDNLTGLTTFDAIAYGIQF